MDRVLNDIFHSIFFDDVFLFSVRITAHYAFAGE